MSSLTGGNLDNAPWNYTVRVGYAAWLHPRRFRAAKGFFPLVAQTLKVPYNFEHPQLLAYATLLHTAYGADGIVRLMTGLMSVSYIWDTSVPLPLGFVTAFLAGNHLFNKKWRYALPALTKIYGVDALVNSRRRENYPEHIPGWVLLESISVLIGVLSGLFLQSTRQGELIPVFMLASLLARRWAENFAHY